jgi:hypothetical protein
MKYRKKPIVIEAVQWTGDNLTEMSNFMPSNIWELTGGELSALEIKTLEGNHLAMPKDFIIKGVKGEFYPCKPDIFEMTYEAAE